MAKMKYIVTPTYRGHFQYIKYYLDSFEHYVQDKEAVTICFTIEENDKEEFQKIIQPFADKVNVMVIIFDDILPQFGVYLTPDNLLRKYGRFSYQTLKKFYTMLYIEAEQFLILDSESSWIRQARMTEMFDSYFKNKCLWGSSMYPEEIGRFRWRVQNNIDLLVSEKNNIWFIENFMWYYDKRILRDLFSSLGTPIEVVEYVWKNGNREEGVFEILLYLNYLYQKRETYGYRFINVLEEGKRKLSSKIWENYYFEENYYTRGECGVFEHAMIFLNRNNVRELAKFFTDMGFDIIRCDNETNKELQSCFDSIVQPKILAASQNHPFLYHAAPTRWIAQRRILPSREKLKQWLRRVWPTYKVVDDSRNVLFANEAFLHEAYRNIQDSLSEITKEVRNWKE